MHRSRERIRDQTSLEVAHRKATVGRAVGPRLSHIIRDQYRHPNTHRVALTVSLNRFKCGCCGSFPSNRMMYMDLPGSLLAHSF